MHSLENMIHFKNSTVGFTLIEVLFAMAIIGMVLTTLFLNQSSLIQLVARRSNWLYRIYAGEQFMVASYIKFEQDNQQRSGTKQIDDPETTLNFRITDPPSVLKKRFHDMFTNSVKIEWEENKVKYSDNLVTFLFLPEFKKE